MVHKKVCPYCLDTITYRNGRQFSSHCGICKKRPGYWKGVEKQRQVMLNKRKDYTFVCRKCNTKYTLNLTEHQFKNNIFRKHCSMKCSNSKIQTKKMNEKRSIKLKGREYPERRTRYTITKKCKICKTIFYCLNYQNYKTCRSKICLTKLNSINAKKREFGGLTSKRKVNYMTKSGKIVHLQSSYEEKIAVELDKYNIEWKRPKYLIWKDNKGKEHRYYPDFYLPNYDIYLDPKNDYLIKKDEEKIKRVKEQNNIKLYMLNSEQLNIKYIRNLIGVIV